MHWADLSETAAEMYERNVVPAIFAPWAEELLARARVRPGERVLDVACGTGVVARRAAAQVGPAGRVVGLDLAPGMLTVARAAAPEAAIEWREGSAAAIPLPDASFDVVTCQQGLQYFPDRAAAAGEMRRVLAPEGRVALAVFSSSAGHRAVAPVFARRFGPDAAKRVLEAVSFSSATELTALIAGAGFGDVAVTEVRRLVGFPSPDMFVGFLIASRFAEAVARLDDASRQELAAEARAALAPWVSEGGGLGFLMASNLLTARK